MIMVWFFIGCFGKAEVAYTDGVYECCAEGEGEECCSRSEDDLCFEYGGLYGECIDQGQEIEGKVICGICCPGMTAAEPMVETEEQIDGYPEGCGPSETPPSLLVCIACGDGLCREGENRCNCPEDCS